MSLSRAGPGLSHAWLRIRATGDTLAQLSRFRCLTDDQRPSRDDREFTGGKIEARC